MEPKTRILQHCTAMLVGSSNHVTLTRTYLLTYSLTNTVSM